MKKLLQKKFLIPLLILGLIAGYYLVLPAFIVIEMDEEITFSDQEYTVDKSEVLENQNVSQANEPVVLSSTDFQKAEYDVKGQAILLQKGLERILRFENFETINGPSLNIYLVNSNNKEIYYDLGKIKATKGNVNYQIPNDLDLSQYDQVQVYCVPFKKVFSFADLNK